MPGGRSEEGPEEAPGGSAEAAPGAASDPAQPPGGNEVDRLVGELRRWSAAQRQAEAARARSTERALIEAGEGSATWTGILLDLAEHQATVALHIAGAVVTGRLVGTGPDFLVLERPASGDLAAGALLRSGGLLVPLDAVDWVVPAPADGPRPAAAPSGGRPAAIDRSLASVLADLAAERAPMRLHTRSGPLEGELWALGEDVLTIRLGRNGPGGRRLAHAPISSAEWYELL